MEHRELDSMAVGRAPSSGDCWRPQSRRGRWERESRGATPWTPASSLLELGPEEMSRPGWSRGGVGGRRRCCPARWSLGKAGRPWDSTLAAGGAELHGRRRLPACFVGKKKVAGGCGKCRGGNAKMAKCKEGAPLFIEEALGLGFQLGQMGWAGLAQNTQSGCAK
jgi:hypothetical protein